MKSMKLLAVLPGNCIQSLSKNFSTGPASLQRHFKILVVGAGAGGCSVANKFAHHVGGEKVGVIEPNDEHYYQPMWTLVGGGVKKLQDSVQKMSKLLPKKGTWMKTKAVAFDPEKCTVTTAEGEEVEIYFYIWNVTSKTCPICRERVNSVEDTWVLTEKPDTTEYEKDVKGYLVSLADRKDS
ncbi:SQOR [Mytilus edulis]|uniref:SQOR n=1 Tax=Mytilus edulis TaxID=6550 RepID=A0A8S3TYS5_MYTED|nr:SQOR [Mytilus edulis]